MTEKELIEGMLEMPVRQQHKPASPCSTDGRQERSPCSMICKVLHRIFGWHYVINPEGHDGCSYYSRCSYCGKPVLQDSQGNWFSPSERAQAQPPQVIRTDGREYEPISQLLEEHSVKEPVKGFRVTVEEK